jgi:hypothetical protein
MGLVLIYQDFLLMLRFLKTNYEPALTLHPNVSITSTLLSAAHFRAQEPVLISALQASVSITYKSNRPAHFLLNASVDLLACTKGQENHCADARKRSATNHPNTVATHKRFHM